MTRTVSPDATIAGLLEVCKPYIGEPGVHIPWTGIGNSRDDIWDVTITGRVLPAPNPAHSAAATRAALLSRAEDLIAALAGHRWLLKSPPGLDFSGDLIPGRWMPGGELDLPREAGIALDVRLEVARLD